MTTPLHCPSCPFTIHSASLSKFSSTRCVVQVSTNLVRRLELGIRLQIRRQLLKYAHRLLIGRLNHLIGRALIPDHRHHIAWDRVGWWGKYFHLIFDLFKYYIIRTLSTLSGVDAHITIASLTIPRILAGFKLHSNTTMRSCICSSGICRTRPEITFITDLFEVYSIKKTFLT